VTPLLTRAETRAGHRYELPSFDTANPEEARRRAIRAAELFAAHCNPQVWAGSRVTVTEAFTGRLVFIARIGRREVRHG
jgi:hypothetical protein